ncbi:MAG: hypothetical protein ACREQQ_16980 [Candidatus Binatia bacterium]
MARGAAPDNRSQATLAEPDDPIPPLPRLVVEASAEATPARDS